VFENQTSICFMLFLSNQHINHVAISIIRTWRTFNFTYSL